MANVDDIDNIKLESYPVNGGKENEENMEVVLKSCLKACPMKGGNGPTSYAQNSYYQRGVMDGAKGLITEAIAENFDLNRSPSFDPNKPIIIADMGCSVGPNTFMAVEIIIQSIELKFQSLHKNPYDLEFQVFFNDLNDNDFNTLFRTLPHSRQYFAAGVPGSFHFRLFPKSSLHIVHSTYSLHWLSMVPKEVVDANSPAWNKGCVHYAAGEEVREAYSAQFQKDILVFLSARAEELVEGGLMVLLVTGFETGVLFSKTCTCKVFDLLGASLMDMAKMGIVSEEKVDSFNLPLYFTSGKELQEVIETNGSFSIERMEELIPPMRYIRPSNEMSAIQFRSVMEGVIVEHFGSGIIDELFARFTTKFGENRTSILDPKGRLDINIFVLLRRKSNLIEEDHILQPPMTKKLAF